MKQAWRSSTDQGGGKWRWVVMSDGALLLLRTTSDPPRGRRDASVGPVCAADSAGRGSHPLPRIQELKTIAVCNKLALAKVA